MFAQDFTLLLYLRHRVKLKFESKNVFFCQNRPRNIIVVNCTTIVSLARQARPLSCQTLNSNQNIFVKIAQFFSRFDSASTFSIMTLSVMSFSITTFSITTLSITTLSVMTFTITTLSIKAYM